MLSTLPKLADRTFIIGFFLPALLSGMAILKLLEGDPRVDGIINNLTAKELSSAVFLLIGMWVLGVVLLVLNHPLYRVLEGYCWPLSRFEWARRWHQRRLARGNEELKTLFDRWMVERDNFPAADQARYQALKIQLATTLPSLESDVLPTAFGNAIKAFEVYPRDVYGADGPTLWPRLASVTPKHFIEQVQDIRTQVDFLINSCALALIVGVLALGRAYRDAPWSGLAGGQGANVLALVLGFQWKDLIWSLVAFVVAFAFYRWAVTRIPAWGQLVMTTFDCFLPSLANRIGFDLPEKGDDRIAFWTAYSQMLIFRRDLNGKLAFRPEDWPRAAVADSTSHSGAQKGHNRWDVVGDSGSNETDDDAETGAGE